MGHPIRFTVSRGCHDVNLTLAAFITIMAEEFLTFGSTQGWSAPWKVINTKPSPHSNYHFLQNFVSLISLFQVEIKPQHL